MSRVMLAVNEQLAEQGVLVQLVPQVRQAKQAALVLQALLARQAVLELQVPQAKQVVLVPPIMLAL